ncbi:cytidine deaminase-like protein [Saitoella complicata NRRL Y-17804]|uniref:Deoxycytidylate deaminase n=1 Tax=Saitoella complicata (strain BCRC 22490 / CBS 7301 / JCM 7358 / NBRC 10748 / NRRL Y-17804) TaxID=698492 RepID=A0A0E9NQK3_SAICN|nr:cytidine deaminase-like protein [Saitoella complicata NRRL Y-17804]ODQ52336.1 cytidine deaminase-like protein [Saitoella complicata NRRL Y-17804]GAO51705.1 hypothetical protein G7K_5798-t1 [Saitoella complicata NRRL Y-17804]
MFVGIAGPICSGKHAVADYLVEKHAFTRIRLREVASVSPALSRLALTPSPSCSDVKAEPKSNDRNAQLVFDHIDEVLEYVTKRWRDHFVTTDIRKESDLETLCKRPFFLALGIDAPVTTRYERFVTRCAANGTPPPSFQNFVAQSDDDLYSSPSPIAPILHRATVRLLNPSQSLTTLHQTLENLNLLDPARLRPTWDAYFMYLADLAARRSNCMKRRVGAVLVRDQRVVSTGYNGTPKGITNCNEGGCPRCNDATTGGHGLSTCFCMHAEENALLESGRERATDAVLYCNTCPCLTCSIKIAQVGIREVVYDVGYSMDEMSAKVLREAGVKLRQYNPPTEGLVMA